MSMSASPSHPGGPIWILSGTLHVGQPFPGVVPGATEAIQALFDASLSIRILTNTSTVSSAALYQQLQEMGFSVNSTPSNLHQCPRHARVSCPTTSPAVLSVGGCIRFRGVVPLDPPHNAVVVGLAPSKFNYQHMNQAYQYTPTASEQSHCDASEHVR
jgi:hypothetical protein